MKQQVMTAPGKIEFTVVDRPEPARTEVLIEIRRIGLCGSDIHVFEGKHPLTDYPVTQGHEVSGIVHSVGAGVDQFSPGDKVTVRPQVVCGECIYCQGGDYHICNDLRVMGFQTKGMAVEYVNVSAELVLKVADHVSIDAIALVEPLAVACSALEKLDTIEQIDLLILGAGPIGNLVAQVAKIKGARSVMITDVLENRLAIASKVGVDHVVNVEEVSLGDTINNVYGSRKADAIIECVGAEQTVEDAIEQARKGTTIVLVGVFGDKHRINLSTVQDHELTLKGMLMYQHRHFEEAVSLLESGQIDTNAILSDHFRFEDYLDAYRYLIANKNNAMKILIDVK